MNSFQGGNQGLHWECSSDHMGGVCALILISYVTWRGATYLSIPYFPKV
jgi:hypothetical protein